MALTKIIKIDEQDVLFRASATIPRLYRAKFRRDIFKDLITLRTALKDSIDKNAEKAKESGADENLEESEETAEISFSSISIDNLEMFENIAFIMAKHADPDNVPDTPEEWLDQFSTLSIYMVFPKLLELWNLNTEQQAESKKNIAQLTVR
ncbi:MAG: hypothetical protein IJ644_11895 [Oscillospiraceae bacterium]|nr:hypothetical protein [Oscillospiraceae bacterium]